MRARPSPRRDHPRVCGEHPRMRPLATMRSGSSPRVRGTPRADTVRDGAWVDHPRVCGEHKNCRGGSDEGAGSSPRVRGTQFHHHKHLRRQGIIPACAGNTPLEQCMRHALMGSSPRVRGTRTSTRPLSSLKGIIPACAGNTVNESTRISLGCGSSPRVRGTLRCAICRSPARGIIPACAGNTRSRRSCSFALRDHPRVCGEHKLKLVIITQHQGSSPRVRGTLLAEEAHAGKNGIIPACAGNTSAPPRAGRASWDHPRVCGEHFRFNLSNRLTQGSSPRVRGTPPPAPPREARGGIIPACAGNTDHVVSFESALRDHPRVCGEHPMTQRTALTVAGSSPRVRGTHAVPLPPQFRPGIIPACAGNTDKVFGQKTIGRDHPRVCGEHLARRWALRRLMGSSPRVRGTLCGSLSAPNLTGIIPACAGNTRVMHGFLNTIWDHPRVCGEHTCNAWFLEYNLGSSPRVRGTHASRMVSACEEGIIPACAGNTFLTMVRVLGRRDHPRVCGEHTSHSLAAFQLVGSSPRVRGTRWLVRVVGEDRGIIPACAGNTCRARSSRWSGWDHPRVCGEHCRGRTRGSPWSGSSPRVRGTLSATPFRDTCRVDHPRVCGEH